MKKSVITVAASLLTALMLTPVADGQTRGRGNMGGGRQSPSASVSRPATRPSDNNASATRPSSGRPGNMGSSNRPGGNNHGNINRPGSGSHVTPPNNNNRPGGNHGNMDRPGGNNHGNINRPGGNHHGNHNRPTPPPTRPGGQRPPVPNHSHRPGHMPPPPPHSVPYRPYMPANRPWMRPVPPPSYRPYGRLPRFNSIFNINFGTTFSISLNTLMNTGYTVAGYGSDVIYLANINQYGYIWPSATMHYQNGVLTGTQFVYSSPGYDMSRYNILYNNLTGQYGYPVSVQNGGSGSISATWWGYDNSYITLSFYPDYAYNGSYRYYTTIQIGN